MLTKRQKQILDYIKKYIAKKTRIGKNRIENGSKSNIKNSHEIIIFCPPKI